MVFALLLVLLAAGHALRPALLWMDMRSAKQAAQVAATGDIALQVQQSHSHSLAMLCDHAICTGPSHTLPRLLGVCLMCSPLKELLITHNVNEKS